MKRLTSLTFVLVTAAALAAGCQKRDDAMTEGAPGAGPGTTSVPGGTSTTPGGGTTTPGDSSTAPGTSGSTSGSMGGSTSTSPAMPPASAASQ